jgi:hypothetical protein
MFLVHAMINTADAGLEKREEFRKKEISFKPGTWVNLLRLFFALDILSPKSIRDKDLNQDEQ